MRTHPIDVLQHWMVSFVLQAVYGVKGKSVLLSLPDFDMVNNNPVDYMHCVLLVVVRTLISLWFDSKNHKEQWYVHFSRTLAPFILLCCVYTCIHLQVHWK